MPLRLAKDNSFSVVINEAHIHGFVQNIGNIVHRQQCDEVIIFGAFVQAEWCIIIKYTLDGAKPHKLKYVPQILFSSSMIMLQTEFIITFIE